MTSGSHLRGVTAVEDDWIGIARPRHKLRYVKRRKPSHRADIDSGIEINTGLLFSVSRYIRQDDDSYQVASYAEEMARANGCWNRSEGEFNYEHGERSSAIRPEELRIGIIEIDDVKEIILNSFAREDGKIFRQAQVERKVRNFLNDYENYISQKHNASARRAENDSRAHSRHFFESNNRKITPDIGEENPLCGKFGIKGIKKGIDKGQVFCLELSTNSGIFIRQERMDTIEFIGTKLGVEIPHRIQERLRKRERYVEIFRKGFSDAIHTKYGEGVAYPFVQPSVSDVPIPKVFPTGLNPRAKLVDA